MNKTITENNQQRIKRCIIDMNNLVHFSEVSGISVATVKRILNRGFAKERQLEAMLSYCDKVEGLTEKTAA